MIRENKLFNRLSESQKEEVRKLVESAKIIYNEDDCELVLKDSGLPGRPKWLVLKYDNNSALLNTGITEDNIAE